MRDPDPRIRTVEHESARGSWRMQFMHPRPDTAPFVDRFCVYSECNTEFHRRREPPAGLATLVFNLGPQLRVELADGSRGTYGQVTPSSLDRLKLTRSPRPIALSEACKCPSLR